MAVLMTSVAEAVARLSVEQLVDELACAERCAMCATRTRRECYLLRAACLRRELERRALESRMMLAATPQAAIPV